jgi:hypothetical protein
MSHYVDDFAGISARFTRPTGYDPNYRGGYRGLRTVGGAGRAAYGAHRYLSRGELGTMGGYGGIHDAPGRPGRGEEEEVAGRVRDPFRDERLLRQYNSRSPSLADRARLPRSRSYDREVTRRERDRDWVLDHRYRGEYSNRGMPPAGFSDGWSRALLGRSR